MWNNQRAAEGLLEGNVSDANFERIWARHSALAQHCSKAKIARHMNTPVVATDIVEMIERYGEWRENETRAEIRLQSFTSDERTAIIKRTAWQPGHEKLQYWGFSYGTNRLTCCDEHLLTSSERYRDRSHFRNLVPQPRP